MANGDNGKGVDFAKAVAGVAVLGTAIGVLSSATGTFDQFQRDEPQWASAVFSVAVLAGFLLLGAGLIQSDTVRLGMHLSAKGKKDLLTALSVIAFFVAAVIGIVWVILVHGNRPAPTIAGSFSTTAPLTITGSIKVQQMASTERLKATVLAQRPASGTPPKFEPPDHLFDVSVGGDSSGNLTLPLDVQIPPKTYRWVTVLAWVGRHAPTGCLPDLAPDVLTRTSGCVVLSVPESAAAP